MSARAATPGLTDQAAWPLAVYHLTEGPGPLVIAFYCEGKDFLPIRFSAATEANVREKAARWHTDEVAKARKREAITEEKLQARRKARASRAGAKKEPQ
jgi:hypothetical protein